MEELLKISGVSFDEINAFLCSKEMTFRTENVQKNGRDFPLERIVTVHHTIRNSVEAQFGVPAESALGSMYSASFIGAPGSVLQHVLGSGYHDLSQMQGPVEVQGNTIVEKTYMRYVRTLDTSP